MKWTKDLLDELKSIEDAISAYENGYYDTHNLDYIGENMEEYLNMIETYKKYLPNNKYGFWAYDFKNGYLVLTSVDG